MLAILLVSSTAVEFERLKLSKHIDKQASEAETALLKEIFEVYPLIEKIDKKRSDL